MTVKPSKSDENARLPTAQQIDAEIITVKTPEEIATKQNLPYFVGISQLSAGARNIAMNMVVIPPGASAKPHYHKDFETAIYILKGRVETRYGEGLKKSVIRVC